MHICWEAQSTFISQYLGVYSDCNTLYKYKLYGWLIIDGGS